MLKKLTPIEKAMRISVALVAFILVETAIFASLLIQMNHRIQTATNIARSAASDASDASSEVDTVKSNFDDLSNKVDDVEGRVSALEER